MGSAAVSPSVSAAGQSRWYADWQDTEHASRFDGRSILPSRSLIRNYEAFNDVRLLNERLGADSAARLLEIGCATGEFSRYLRLKRPRLSYTGIDISKAAVARARQKYPQARFFVSDAGQDLQQNLAGLELPTRWEAVYTKDVIHHQTDPFGFLSQLLGITQGFLIFRTRTRDRGPTVLDAEISCQYHYQGWMPYIVLNLQELTDRIRRLAPGGEILLFRNRMVLGGVGGRFLPKDCYLPETGTAETAVGVFLETAHPGRVRLMDREERPAPYPLSDRARLFLRRMLRRR